MPNVVALSSSPTMGKGNTSVVLRPFLEGMEAAGAETELIYTRNLKVKPCLGDLGCWLKTPGECFQDDDMAAVLPKMAAADIWVIAGPVYVDGMAGTIKMVLDRIMPLMEPFFVVNDGHCRHPMREGTKGGSIVVVSSCGLWEMDNFDPLLAHVKAICRNADRDYAGALLRPHAPLLKRMAEKGKGIVDILDAAHSAGRQLIEEGRMAPETLETVSRELLPRDVYNRVANQSFRRLMAENGVEASKNEDKD